ncbi:MSHA biogenesis protein MshF [Vibrio ouci]|uniref:MSHA biogenesis protein MshF n=1 Tax=Vibrio ouci TaxID=2499078 RepID=A0A4Y8WHI0_9VIBR|nr:MSHA biogenesis protein MshF [Vibrio ouci]TFH92123.1 MSHA biogenesis protein MshF [Vibrio ouci]
MPSKASLITNLERSRLVIWLLVIIILVMSFLLVWKEVEREASDTAFLVASKRVIEQAGYYKQQWLLAGQKQTLELDGKLITYTDSGWVLPMNVQQQKDCAFLLDILYPEKEVLGSFPVAIESEFIGSSYRCNYLYNQEQFISIGLINNKFSAKVGFLAN